MHTMPLSKRLLRRADLGLSIVSSGNGTLVGKGACADLKEIYGLVRCDTAGTLTISQGFVDEAGVEQWVAADTVAVSASTYSSGFTVVGAKVPAIAIVGEIFKAEMKLTSGGPTSNFQLNLLGR